MTAEPLTPRQRDVLEFIEQRLATCSTPPTLREICQHFGFRCSNAAKIHVDQLLRKGWLHRMGHARGLVPTRPASWKVRLESGMVRVGPLSLEPAQAAALALEILRVAREEGGLLE